MKVRFVVLNLRMGGQFSSILSLHQKLTARGIDSAILLPRAVGAATKKEIERFASRSFVWRAWQMIRLLRTLRERAGDDAVVHLVLPSPALSWVMRLASVRPARMIAQYEAGSAGRRGERFQAFAADPVWVAPRLIVNNSVWSVFGRSLPATHVSTYPHLTAELRESRFGRVREIPNVAEFAPEDVASSSPFERAEGEIWIGYIGHGHPVKGVLDLIDAFALAVRVRPELRLFVALSADRDSSRVALRVRQLASPAILLVRDLVPVRTVLERIDALALPYRSLLSTTIYPSLLLEAAEARCPVVLSRMPELEGCVDYGAPDLYECAPRDVRSIAAALARVRRRSSGGHPYLMLPDRESIVDRWVELYREVLER